MDFQANKITRDKEGHWYDKGINPSRWHNDPKCVHTKQQSQNTWNKEEMDKSTNIAGHFNNLQQLIENQWGHRTEQHNEPTKFNWLV